MYSSMAFASIAAGEYAFAAGLTVFICLDAALLGSDKSVCGAEDQRIGTGADGDDDCITINDPVGIGDGNRSSSSFFIRLAQFHLLNFHSDDTIVLVAKDLYRVVQQCELDSFGN